MTLSDIIGEMITFGLAYLGGPVIGGVTSILLFLKLAPGSIIEKFFGHQLDQRMEALKREYSGEIETLKSNLSHLQDRGVRSNEREYEALTGAWGKFMDAFYAVRRTVGGFATYPDFASMNDEDTLAFLTSAEVSDFWQKKIMTASDRHKAYSRMLQVQELDEASNALVEVRNVVRRQSVFMPVELYDHFERAIYELTRVLSERRVSFQINKSVDPELSIKLVGEEGEALLASLRDDVRKRLLRDG